MGLVEKVKSLGIIKEKDRIVLGVSGGPDSICLFDVLLTLRESFNLSLFVVHVNHCIREEAVIEEEYVRKLCREYDIPFYCRRVNVEEASRIEKKSLEEAARDIRYSIFNEVLEEVNANKIAVAHNANDLVETVIMNFIRGAGIQGFSGIMMENGNIIRPLVNITREEIEEYIKERGLTVFYDRTNLETEYTRNKVRNIIIPKFLEINPNFIETTLRSTTILNGQKRILERAIDKLYSEVYIESGVLDNKKFLELEREYQLEVLRKAIYEVYGKLTDIGFKNLNNALDIINKGQSGSIIEILPDLKIKISYDLLKFFSEKKEIDFCYEVKIDGETYIPEINKKIITKVVKAEDVPNKYENKNKCFFDIEKTGKKIYVRNRKNGDYFFPSGMDGKKTLKKFFSDLKVDIDDRNKIPIISTDNEIIWVAGFRTSKKFLKDKNTKEVIIFEYGENI